MQTARKSSVEFAYHEVTTKVEELISSFGGDTIYDRDYKNDPTSYTGMHSFVTSTFFGGYTVSCSTTMKSINPSD